jgi:hypothetical protein
MRRRSNARPARGAMARAFPPLGRAGSGRRGERARAAYADRARPSAPTPRTFSTLFVSTVTSGPVEIAVERLRDGKRMSQLRAEVRNPGRPEVGHATSAAFGESRPAVEFHYGAAPEVGPPGDYPLPADPPPGAPVFRARFFENVETRRVRLFTSEQGWGGRAPRRSVGCATKSRWHRMGARPLRRSCWPTPCRRPSGSTSGPARRLYAPSVDLNMHFFADTEAIGARAQRVSSAGTATPRRRSLWDSAAARSPRDAGDAAPLPRSGRFGLA